MNRASLKIGRVFLVLTAFSGIGLGEELRLELQPDEQLLLAASRNHDGAEPRMGTYFQEVMPIASKYGFAPRGHLDVMESDAGSFKPNNWVGFYSFPSAENSRQFEKDLRWPPVKAMRPSIWSDLRISRYEIGIPAVLHFKEGKVYEVRYEWFKAEETVPERSIPGKGKLIATLAGGQHEIIPADLKAPSRIRLIEWPDLATAKAHRPRAEGYLRLDLLYTRTGRGSDSKGNE